MRFHVKLIMKAAVFLKSTCMFTISLPRIEKPGTKEECIASFEKTFSRRDFFKSPKGNGADFVLTEKVLPCAVSPETVWGR